MTEVAIDMSRYLSWRAMRIIKGEIAEMLMVATSSVGLDVNNG
jgi:hypothetical protein